MIRYIKGDVLDSNAVYVLHGCNCVGGFGSGVAGQIAKKYPHVKDAYLHKFRTVGWELGDVQYVSIEKVEYVDNRFIVNCATQYNYLPRNINHFDTKAFTKILTQVRNAAICLEQFPSIAMPKIGSGLAGGSWEDAEQIINEVFGNEIIDVYVLE
jgi:O-acetyl-ADP-ribose deacetylase (regulator of RNase III)